VSLFEDPADISRRTDCMEEYIKKGIAIACFYYARCLSLGRGVQQDEDEARKLYSRVSKWNWICTVYCSFLPSAQLPVTCVLSLVTANTYTSASHMQLFLTPLQSFCLHQWSLYSTVNCLHCAPEIRPFFFEILKMNWF